MKSAAKREYDRKYYLEHDGKNRKRIEDVDYVGEKNANWKGGLVTIKCEVCGKEKQVKQKDVSHSKYCSIKCSGVGRGKVLSENAKAFRVKSNCLICGKEVLTKPSHAKNGEGKYCSNPCRAEGFKETFKNMKYDRIDANHNEIVSALEGAGASVQSLTRVKFGCPDICVGYHGVNYLFEIKVKKGKLTPSEERFFSEWKGQAVVIRSAEDALKVMGLL